MNMNAKMHIDMSAAVSIYIFYQSAHIIRFLFEPHSSYIYRAVVLLRISIFFTNRNETHKRFGTVNDIKRLV